MSKTMCSKPCALLESYILEKLLPGSKKQNKNSILQELHFIKLWYFKFYVFSMFSGTKSCDFVEIIIKIKIEMCQKVENYLPWIFKIIFFVQKKGGRAYIWEGK